MTKNYDTMSLRSTLIHKYLTKIDHITQLLFNKTLNKLKSTKSCLKIVKMDKFKREKKGLQFNYEVKLPLKHLYQIILN